MQNSKRNSVQHKSKPSPDMKAISQRRMACVDQIERLRTENAPSAFVQRASSLLSPRYWQNANWRARAEILDSVEWLLRLSRTSREFDAKA